MVMGLVMPPLPSKVTNVTIIHQLYRLYLQIKKLVVLCEDIFDKIGQFQKDLSILKVSPRSQTCTQYHFSSIFSYVTAFVNDFLIASAIWNLVSDTDGQTDSNPS